MVRFAALFLALLLAPLQAQSGVIEDCNQLKDTARTIKGCTVLIKKGGHSKKNFHIIYYKRAVAYGETNKLEDAVADYSKSLTYDPTSAYAYQGRGIIYRRLDQYERSISDFDKAMQHDPKRKNDFLVSRAVTYERWGKLQKALDDFNAVRVTEPSDGEIWKSVTRLKQQIARRGPVVPSWAESWAREKREEAQAYLQRATTLRKEGLLGNALEYYAKAIKLRPDFAEAYNSRAWMFFKAGKAAKGLPDANKAIELKPKFSAAYDTRGHIYEATGEKEKAIADFRKALELDPQNKKRLEPLKRLGAAPATNQASNIPSPPKPADKQKTGVARMSPASWQMFGAIKYAKGEYDEAIEAYTKVLAFEPKSAKAHRDRGMAYAMKGETALANRDFATARWLDPEIVIEVPNKDVAARPETTPSRTAASEMELAFWNDVKDSKDPSMLKAYLDQFPNGTFAVLARLKIQKLKKAQ